MARTTSFLVLAVAVGLLGCGTYALKSQTMAQKTFKFQEEAGSVFVGIQSVAPFTDYIDSLQPKFSLSPEDALTKAIPTTQIQQLADLRAMLLTIAINLASRNSSVTDTLARTSETTTSSRSETSTRTSGAVPASAIPSELAAALTQVGDSVSSLAPEPVLNYKLASNLLQEIAIISSYIKDAAVDANSAPYIARLILTVFPSTHGAPYDIYTNISFLAGSGTPFVYNRPVSLTEIDKRDLREDLAECAGRPIRVIPLFATDNLEATILKSAREAVVGVAGSIGGSVGPAGLGLGGRSQSESTSASLERRLNAVFTLGLASANTLAIRLGAAKLDTGYEMLPRTYNITTLVLAETVTLSELSLNPPEAIALKNDPSLNLARLQAIGRIARLEDNVDTTSSQALTDAISQNGQGDQLILCPGVLFQGNSSFRNAVTGITLPKKGLLSSYLKSQGLDQDARYRRAIEADSFHAFRAVYKQDSSQQSNIGTLWANAVSIRSSEGLAAGKFEVPRSFVRFFSSAHTNVALQDDGKKSTLLILGASGLTSKGLSGEMVITNAKNNQKVRLFSSSAAVINEGTGAKVEFPPIKKSLLAAGATELSEVKILTRVQYSPPLQRWSSPFLVIPTWSQEDTPVIFTSTDPPTANFSIAAGSPHIRCKSDGQGQFVLDVKSADAKLKEIRISIEGATTNDVSSPARLEKAERILPVNSSYTISLSNLVAGTTIKIKAWRKEEADGTTVFAPEVSLFVHEALSSASGRGAGIN